MAAGSRTKLERRAAFSTGQAARYCFVTAETILNWIHAGEIRAQRTAGGQFRILLEDLRSFMQEKGMDTALLDEEKDVRPYCWEYHCEISSHYGDTSREVCAGCLVRRSGTLNCWELHGLLPATRRRFARCQECGYYARWERDEEPSVQSGRDVKTPSEGG
jgi:excisionase family DNA binding protein